MIHPSPEKLRQLSDRWIGEEARLQRIAEAILAGEDWTAHLRGLPHVDEIPPREGEAYGRDLRGANLKRFLHPPVEVMRATERDAALIASVTLEAMRNNTPLPDASPFPADVESAEGVTLAMRRGDRFLLARLGRRVVGAARWATRREFQEFTDGREYGEISGLAVAVSHRRVGIGTLLLATTEWDVAAEGLNHALLRTSMELGLVPFYESRGYRVRHVRQHTYPDAPAFLDAVLTKRLAVLGAGDVEKAAPTGVAKAASLGVANVLGQTSRRRPTH